MSTSSKGKPGLVGTLVGVTLGAALAFWSCTTNRPSEQYKCSTQADCGEGRVCTQGYCIVGQLPNVDAAGGLDAAVCPAICGNTCDFAMAKCTIVGTGSGNITCPAGWNCTIECPTPGACGTISCSNAQSCDVNCTANDACLGITCTTKPCDVTCTGTNACGNIACTTGNCVATCTGADACGNMQCTTGNCTQTCSGGAGSAVCGSLACTTGDCTRTCTGASACGTMSCGGGACTETCSGGSAACGTINCGTGPCSATCQGADPACGTVNCTSSCKCDVACDDVTDTCPADMNCKDAPSNKFCTPDGMDGGRCTSTTTAANNCNQC